MRELQAAKAAGEEAARRRRIMLNLRALSLSGLSVSEIGDRTGLSVDDVNSYLKLFLLDEWVPDEIVRELTATEAPDLVVRGLIQAPAGGSSSAAGRNQEKAIGVPADDDWSPGEVDACVTAYFAMLSLEIASRPYTKAEFNKKVQQATGRSKGSVEFKFQNVSAVLERLGLRWIEGYKPARNAQVRAVQDALEERLGRDHALAERLERPLPTEAPPAPTNPDEVFTEPPPRSTPATPSPGGTPGSTARKFDRASTDARHRALGRGGERFVVGIERRWLTTHGRSDLAAKIVWVSEEQGDGPGYDVLSFDVDGTQRLIEVKTTNGDASQPFFVTANEVEVSRVNSDTYWLYRVYDFAGTPRIYRQRGALDEGWTLLPTVYRAYR